jgi:rod shape-determining protein MreD
MLPLKRRTQFTPPPTALEAQLVPVISTMVGSMVVLAPNIATEPLLPPFGLMVFLGWRLLRGDIWPLWMGLPLGLWDDLFSGQPIGTAMCGWTAIMLALDYLDRRTPFRDHRQDWMLAGLAIAGYLLFALAIAWVTGGVTSPVTLIPQMLLSALLFPLIARVCAALDRWRSPR